MYEAVRSGESRYSERQREAWVPAPRSGPEWTARLAGQDVIVAEEEGEILGFMSLASGGYVDFAYIRPRARHSGLFRQLYELIEALAASRGHDLLSVHASLTAEPAFSAVGFAIGHEEEVELGGERFQRFAMEKRLSI
jgi:putative acetyltransferase